jgi:hypothetical protein
MYKLLKNVLTNQVDVVQKEESGFLYSIPMNPDNTDYIAFLKWIEAGNSPEPAEENQ